MPFSATNLAIIALAAAGGAVAGGQPTGWAPADIALRAALAAAITMLATRAKPWAWVAAAGLAVGFAGRLDTQVAAVVVLGVATAAAGWGLGGPHAGAVVGGGLAQVLLRLGDLGGHGRSSIIAAEAVAILAGSAWVTSDARQRARLAQLALGACIPALAVLDAYLVALVQARPSLSSGLAAAEVGLAAARRGEAAGAELLGVAQVRLAKAHDGLGAWWARPALALPVVGQHARALLELTDSLGGLTAPARELARLSTAPSLQPRQGRLEPAALAPVQQPLVNSLAALDDSLATLGRVRSPWLVSAATRRMDLLAATLSSAAEDGRSLAMTADVLPALLGTPTPRRYFLAVQNPAEQRASGGIIGAFAELTVTDGRIALDRLGTNAELDPPGAADTRRLSGQADYLARYSGFGPDRYFLNATLSPDFPTVARAITELYPQSGGRAVDGVISVDPVGLAGLLAITGPIAIADQGEPLTADNVAAVLLNEHYLRLDGVARDQFLLDATRAVFDRLTSMTLPAPGSIVAALAPAVRGKHLLMASTAPTEQALLNRLGVAGAVRPVDKDFLQVVTQNNGQNKIDWYQQRNITYNAVYNSATGEVRSRLRLAITNQAPAVGAPDYVIGGLVSRPGESRMWVSIYSPLALDQVTVGGRAAPWKAETELGRNVYSGFVAAGPGESVNVEVVLRGRVTPGPVYRLDVGAQPTITSDRLCLGVVDQRGRTPVRSRNTGCRLHDGDTAVAALFGGSSRIVGS